MIGEKKIAKKSASAVAHAVLTQYWDFLDYEKKNDFASSSSSIINERLNEILYIMETCIGRQSPTMYVGTKKLVTKPRRYAITQWRENFNILKCMAT